MGSVSQQGGPQELVDELQPTIPSCFREKKDDCAPTEQGTGQEEDEQSAEPTFVGGDALLLADAEHTSCSQSQSQSQSTAWGWLPTWQAI